MTENRGFLYKKQIFTAEEDFIEHVLGKSDKRREELLNSVNIPRAKAVARNEILRSLLNVIPNADLLYTNSEF